MIYLFIPSGDLGGFNRGYTGHEHIDQFGIINMNGRVYDPLTSQFLSPDPYVQAPDNWLNYNRYAYCLNNPFKYTDPDGEWIHIVIGGVVGGVINLGIKAFQGKINSWGDGFAAFGIGAVAGAAGGAAGTAFSSLVLSMGNSAYFGDPLMTPQQYLLGIAGGAILSGGFNGTVAAFNGRGFWDGSLPSRSTPVPTITVPKPQVSDAPDLMQTMAEKYPGKVLDMPEVYPNTPNNSSLGNSFQPVRDIEGNIIGYTREVVAKGGTELIEAGEYMITKTVSTNLATRPYINSPSTITNIMGSGKGVPDLWFKGGMNWKVPGTFNNATGIFELGINPETNTIYHFLFRTVK